MRRTAGLLIVGAIVALSSLSSCRSSRDIDVTARTRISGTINGGPIEAEIVATFNTGRGGTSTCRFPRLPTGFNPGTIGTHA